MQKFILQLTSKQILKTVKKNGKIEKAIVLMRHRRLLSGNRNLLNMKTPEF